MTEKINLRGMTWDHSRGYDPMVATSVKYMELNPNVSIKWDKRSLQAFADRPIEQMAGEYDMMVIDHPHVGEVARAGNLLALDSLDRADELSVLASQSVGVSHRSYEFDGHQWALAIDAATPVAAFRSDQIKTPPSKWNEVLELSKSGRVAFALIPLNTLMAFLGLARNMEYSIAEDPEQLIDFSQGQHVLELIKEIVELVDERCLKLDPIGILEWMGRSSDGPVYSPFGYGYTNYSREGYCEFPVTFWDAPGLNDNGPRGTVIGGTGIAVSAFSSNGNVAADYAFWIAGAECQTGLYYESGGQPGNSVAWEDDQCNASCRNFFRNTRQTLETAWLRPRYDGYMRFQNAAGDILHQFLLGELDIKSTLDRLQALYLESRS